MYFPLLYHLWHGTLLQNTYTENMKLLKGKKYKFIHTRDIYLDDIRRIFFPKNFEEKYGYLGSLPYAEETGLFKAILPLILTMDYYAKPKWCPRWFLRFLHLFGNDNSVVRVRNWRLHELYRKLTKGIFFVDYKTKWTDYDLRISIYGDQMLNDLANDIEVSYYKRGRKVELLEQLREIPDSTEHYNDWDSIQKLEEVYDGLTKGDE